LVWIVVPLKDAGAVTVTTGAAALTVKVISDCTLVPFGLVAIIVKMLLPATVGVNARLPDVVVDAASIEVAVGTSECL
jgi:hypothetical protein